MIIQTEKLKEKLKKALECYHLTREEFNLIEEEFISNINYQLSGLKPAKNKKDFDIITNKIADELIKKYIFRIQEYNAIRNLLVTIRARKITPKILNTIETNVYKIANSDNLLISLIKFSNENYRTFRNTLNAIANKNSSSIKGDQYTDSDLDHINEDLRNSIKGVE